MTVSSQTARNDYTGNGVTVLFPITFRFLNNTHLRVLRTVIATGVATELVLNGLGPTGYTVSGAGQPNGGQVTVNLAPASTERLTIMRNMPFTQLIDYIANDPFPANSHETGLDERTMENQQIREQVGRAIVLSPTVFGVSTELPGPDPLAPLVWSADGTRLENGDFTGTGDLLLRPDLSDGADPNKGAALVDWRRTATVGNQVRSVSRLLQANTKNVAEFLTNPGDPITASVLQTALDSFGPFGGILEVEDGAYSISTTVWVKYPVLIRCRAKSETTSNPNGTQASGITWNWTGANGGIMFFFCQQDILSVVGGTTTGQALVGGGMVGCKLYGKASGSAYAACGIWACSTQYMNFEVDCFGMSGEAILLDGGNGIISYNNEVNLHAIWGVDVGQQGMHGVRLRRFNSVSSTQNLIYCTGLLFNGDMVRCDDTDNNIVFHLHAANQNPGTGKAARFRNTGMAVNSDNNLIVYCNGNIHTESACKGNRVLHHNSEGAGITADTGGIIHWDAVDYVDGGLFETARFTMFDTLFVSAEQMGIVSVATRTLAALLYPSLDLPDAATSVTSFLRNGPLTWNDGQIFAIEPVLSCETAVAGNVRLNIRVSTVTQNSGSLATPEYSESFTVTPSAAAFVPSYVTCTLTTPQTFLRNQVLAVVVERAGTDGADSKLATVKLLGVNIYYRGTGPNSAGSGPYSVPGMGS